MSKLIVRPYEPHDEEGFFAVRSLVYNDGQVVPPERRTFKYARGFVCQEEGDTAGIFVALDMTATRRDATLKCAGVAAVGVAPEKRRSGVGSVMMSWLPKRMKEEGIALCSLYAYREPFYRKAGYEICGQRVKITCPTHRIPKTRSDMKVRRLTPSDWKLLEPCYNAFAHARSGLNIRTELQWERVLNENKPLTIYAIGEPIEAYIAVSHQVAFWETQHLSEFVWSSRAGYEGALSVMEGIAINKTALTWFEPSDSPLYAKWLDQGIEAELTRPIMYRANDVALCLRSLTSNHSGEFRIAVVDDIVEDNVGPWRVAFGPDGTTVEKCDSADITLDVRQFIQAFLGSPSLEDLARIGLVQISDAKAFEAAKTLMSPTPTYCIDFF